MGDPITMGLGLGQMGLGYYEQQQAKKQSHKLYGQSEKAYQQAHDEALRFYDEALAHMSGAGATAKRGLSEQGVRDTASLRSDAISRGLYGTNYVDQGRRAISSDVSRGRASIDEQTASMIAQALMGKASLLSGIDVSHAGGLQNFNVQPGQAPDLLGFAQLFHQGGGGGGGGSQQNQGYGNESNWYGNNDHGP